MMILFAADKQHPFGPCDCLEEPGFMCGNQATIRIIHNGKTMDFCSSCYNEMVEAMNPPIVTCSCCEEKGSQFDITRCENCGEAFCDRCWHEEGRTWRGMNVCESCKGDLVADKGPDLEDLIAAAEYREDR